MGTGCSSEKSVAGVIDNKPPQLKIAIVGDPEVGKTSVLLRYIRNQFSAMYIPTAKVAIENVVRKVNVPAHTVVSLSLWDIPGREDMDMHKSYFRNLDAAIVVVDMNDQRCIEMAPVWKQMVLNKVTKSVVQTDHKQNNNTDSVPNVPVDPVTFPVLLLGNKYDLIEHDVHQRATNQMAGDVTMETIMKHEHVQKLEEVADDHGFVGSIMVASNKGDNSVNLAIQSLVRHVLEKKNVPRKWKLIDKEEQRKKEDKEYYYDKLEMTGIEKFDETMRKADILVKKVSMLKHYLTVSLARVKEMCVQGSLIKPGQTSLEDCMIGLKKGLQKGTSLRVEDDEGFYWLEVIEPEEGVTTKQSLAWRTAYKCFHNEYAAICKAIIKDCPTVEIELEKYNIVMSRLTEDAVKMTTTPEGKPYSVEEKEKISNTIVFNRAKCLHAKAVCRKSLETVEAAGRKISAASLWD